MSETEILCSWCSATVGRKVRAGCMATGFWSGRVDAKVVLVINLVVRTEKKRVAED